MLWHWSTDIERLKKEHPKDFKLWRLSNVINNGLEGVKLSRSEVKKNWNKIKNALDPERRKVLEFFIWGKKWKKEAGLAPDRSNFWSWYFKKATS